MMNTNLLRFIDKYLGLPLCWFLSIYRYILELFRTPKSRPSPQKILFIKLSEMGSTVFLYPSITELKKRIPEIEIFFLVFQNNRQIVEELKFTSKNNILGVRTDSIIHLIRSGFRILRMLRKQSIDTCIDMDFFSRLSSVLAFLICSKNRIGFHQFNNEGLARGNLLTHKVMYSSHIHTSQAFFALIKTIFPETPEETIYYKGHIDQSQFELPHYVPSKETVAKMKEKIHLSGASFDNTPKKLVIVNPNSSDIFPLRKWPLNNFAEFSKRLLKEKSDTYIVLTGTHSEKKDALYITNYVNDKRCINLVGQTDFKDLLALYSLADLMVTNDSGPAHFATLLDLPEIVLFGPETPLLYKPLGNACKCLYANYTCSPCVSVYNAKKSPCKDNQCLKAISVDQVVFESLNML
ncbi:MAG: Glycosyl transferase family 9 [Candidatus Magnetoglobus multicellularis str. Araruama]|uniref:Glycosyl transferase family 9 n=1 Tax=Candidatus Magnetoglobus multicellularis str. Araruama TaxID=890399 RepID=A0A1V1PE61_9BACT|nr:MAG: Glycosyl transferase family 9 [Candidatus Magnetoglobus multicellularis str. Araruama]